ncbi:conserved hypothetical protein [Culex quinquefasciatus]|uniref:Uncharacterized protein n=1 Tax=Culex quinquefasciatus TaxID=7176 RepID=B0X8Y2_CULQU|nr:conserved hypothetical protein [Culex quinquefasciatus]|eukprot:XP_001866104.1 conserved hypothetical protein [Culex quinquefasciatus]
MRLNYITFGLRSLWFHATNVVLHAAACVLFTRVCSTIAGLRKNFAVFAGVLFAVHPIHTEALYSHHVRAFGKAMPFPDLVHHHPPPTKFGQGPTLESRQISCYLLGSCFVVNGRIKGTVLRLHDAGEVFLGRMSWFKDAARKGMKSKPKLLCNFVSSRSSYLF